MSAHTRTTRYPALSPREQEILDLIWAGLMNKEISYILKISTKTVEAHRINLMHKLRASNVAQLLRAALEAGLITMKGGTA